MTKMEKPIVKARNKVFEIEDPEKPFKDDKLGREEYAKILTSIVGSFTEGAVIALNGAWGTGKSTFLKMWSQHLKNEGFPVVYYNAWEDDICDEPLLSMLRGLKGLNNEEGLDEVFKIGVKVFLGTISGAFSAVTGVVGKVAQGAIEGGMKQLEESIYETLKEDDDRLKLMQSFKVGLTDYMTTVCDNGKPLIFMVDELDRCNPSFAVKVLERIKHLFEVPNIVFILSIDKQQLACSVKGFSGSSEINADEYLRRFIDFDYYLPEPEVELFCEYLYGYYDYDSFLLNEYRIGQDYLGYNKSKAEQDKSELLLTAKIIAKYKHLSLRQIERVFSVVKIGLCSMPIRSEFLPRMFFFLAYLKTCEPEMFEKISGFSYDLQGLVDAIEKWVTDDMLIPDYVEEGLLYSLMANTLSCYYDGYFRFLSSMRKHSVKLFVDNQLTVDFNKFDKDRMGKCIHGCSINEKIYTIDFITRRLNLLEQLTNTIDFK